MANLVNYASDSTISTITLDDGKANVMSVHMLSELNTALDRAEAENTVVLLTGREGVFSAGFDLQVFKQDRAAQIEMLTAGAKITERLLSFPSPVIVACTGHAIAMGVFLLLSADVRIGVSDGNAKLRVNEVAIGMTVPYFATEVCRQRLAPAHFNRAVITAQPYNSLQAVDAGFLDELAPASELNRVARDQAQALAKLVRQSHAATKLRAREPALRALRRGIELDISDWNAR